VAGNAPVAGARQNCIFNRSYYENVLMVRVHQEYLAKQHLPPNW